MELVGGTWGGFVSHRQLRGIFGKSGVLPGCSLVRLGQKDLLRAGRATKSYVKLLGRNRPCRYQGSSNLGKDPNTSCVFIELTPTQETADQVGLLQ